MTGMRRACVIALVALVAAPAPAAECVFVTSGGLDALTVVDPVRQRISGQLPVGARPVAAAVSRDGRTVWTANQDGDTVTVVDLASGRVAATVAVGRQPADVAAHPDGMRMLVSERGDGRVALLDVATRAVVGRIAAQGSGSAGLAIRTDGSRAYVANSFSNDVGILDLAEGRGLGRIAVGEYPFDVALSPDETRLYTADVEAGTMTVIDLTAGAVIDTVELGGNPTAVAVHPNGGLLYVSNAPLGGVTAVDAATLAVIDAIELQGGADLGGVVMGGDGALAFTVDFAFANLFAIDTATHRTRWFAPAGGLGSTPDSLAFAALPAACPASPTPRLTGAVGAADVLLPLERADLLPVAGTLRVGDELIVYDGRELRVAVRVSARGAGGTQAAAHADGTPALLVGTPGDANCDARTGAADLSALLRQLPSGDPGPCGGDVERDGAVTPADLPRLIALLFDPL